MNLYEIKERIRSIRVNMVIQENLVEQLERLTNVDFSGMVQLLAGEFESKKKFREKMSEVREQVNSRTDELSISMLSDHIEKMIKLKVDHLLKQIREFKILETA